MERVPPILLWSLSVGPSSRSPSLLSLLFHLVILLFDDIFILTTQPDPVHSSILGVFGLEPLDHDNLPI